MWCWWGVKVKIKRLKVRILAKIRERKGKDYQTLHWKFGKGVGKGKKKKQDEFYKARWQEGGIKKREYKQNKRWKKADGEVVPWKVKGS